MKKAVIYIRCSTSKTTNDKLSLVGQTELCVSYAQKNHYEIVEIISDLNKSSSTTFPILITKLVEEKNKIDVLICYSLDRLSRNMDLFFISSEKLRERGIKIEAVSSSNNMHHSELQTSLKIEENLKQNLRFSITQFDRDMKAERVKKAMKSKFEMGYWLWKPPFGYEKQPNSEILRINEEEAKIVRGLFSTLVEFQNGNAPFYVDLRSIGINYQISTDQVYSIIRNPFYKGFMQSKSWKLVVKGKHEPLVSEMNWDKAQI